MAQSFSPWSPSRCWRRSPGSAPARTWRARQQRDRGHQRHVRARNPVDIRRVCSLRPRAAHRCRRRPAVAPDGPVGRGSAAGCAAGAGIRRKDAAPARPLLGDGGPALRKAAAVGPGVGRRRRRRRARCVPDSKRVSRSDRSIAWPPAPPVRRRRNSCRESSAIPSLFSGMRRHEYARFAAESVRRTRQRHRFAGGDHEVRRHASISAIRLRTGRFRCTRSSRAPSGPTSPSSSPALNSPACSSRRPRKGCGSIRRSACSISATSTRASAASGVLIGMCVARVSSSAPSISFFDPAGSPDLGMKFVYIVLLWGLVNGFESDIPTIYGNVLKSLVDLEPDQAVAQRARDAGRSPGPALAWIRRSVVLSRHIALAILQPRPAADEQPSPIGAPPSFAAVVPAYNEAADIGATCEALLAAQSRAGRNRLRR